MPPETLNLCELLRAALSHEREASRVYTDLMARTESTDSTPDREFTRTLIHVMALDAQMHVQALSRIHGQYCGATGQ